MHLNDATGGERAVEGECQNRVLDVAHGVVGDMHQIYVRVCLIARFKGELKTGQGCNLEHVRRVVARKIARKVRNLKHFE